jgi:hypothetical protein
MRMIETPGLIADLPDALISAGISTRMTFYDTHRRRGDWLCLVLDEYCAILPLALSGRARSASGAPSEQRTIK